MVTNFFKSIFLAVVPFLFLAGCNAFISVPQSFDILGSSSVILKQCTPLTLSLTQPAQARSDTSLPLTTSQGQLFLSLSDCLQGLPSSSIVVKAGDSSAIFYYRNATGAADSITSGSIASLRAPFAVTSVPALSFSSGTGFNGTVNAVAVDPANSYRLYVSGSFTSYNGTTVPSLVRLLQNGSLDPAFNPGTGLTGGYASSIKILNDGRVYLGGSFTGYNGTSSANLVRILPTGAIDPTFNVGSGFNGQIQRTALLTDGSNSLYVCGLFTQFNSQSVTRIARIGASGGYDTTFAVGTGLPNQCTGMALASDGSQSVYISFVATTVYNGQAVPSVFKVRSDGTVDSSFGIPPSGLSSQAFGVWLSPFGKRRLIIASDLTSNTYNGVGIPLGVTALNENGTLDTTLNIGVGLTAGTLYDAIADENGLIYLAGSFTGFGGASLQSLARLTANGTIDADFQMGTGFNAPSYQGLPVGDGTGRVYYYGQFATYQGTSVGRIVCLNKNGSLQR